MRKVLFIAVMALLALSGCAAENHSTLASAPAGFWVGLWHGICAPFSLIGIMFGMDIGIYDSFNTGNWYNFGFLLGVGGLSGGSASSRRKL